MNLYFNFFNDKDSKYFIMNHINNTVNINLNKFNMKIYLSDLHFDYSEITYVKLYVERIVDNLIIFDRYIDGVINRDTIDFTNVFLDDIDGNAIYKIRLQFYNGGVLFHDEVNNICTINLKTFCDNFYIDIFDAIKINDVYELQSFTDEQFEMKFKIKLNKTINEDGSLYNFVISPEENIKFDDNYHLFDIGDEYLTSTLVPELFKDNVTYLHFSIKDQFGNIITEKFKITTKSGTLSLFEILNNELVIKYNEEFAVFYNSKNVKTITPYITYMSNGTETTKKSDKIISSYDKRINVITIKLTDYFEIDSKFNGDIKLKFILNNDEKLFSNEMLISIDSNKPKIFLTNIRDAYQLITTDDEYFTVNGKLEDNNFFYIGSSQKKIDISQSKNMLYIYSKENIKYVSFGVGEKKPVLKYSNFYVIESKGYDFNVYDDNCNLITNYEYINDYCNQNEKNIYFIFKQTDFTKYELNIIGKNHGLKIKGKEIEPYIKEQLFSTFNDTFYLRVTLDNTLLSGVEFTKFDLGIDGLQYSFLYKVNQHNCSADLNNIKKLNLNFVKTKIMAIKSNETLNIYKCNENKITGTKNSIILEEVSFAIFSIKNNENIIVDSNYVFFEDDFNLIAPSYIYGEPKLTLNKSNVSYKNYIIKELDENNYSFSLDVPLQKGINKYSLSFVDENDLQSEIEFTIEKNKNDISIDIDETYNNYFDKSVNEDGIYVLTTNRESVIVKFIIENESLLDLKTDKYIIITSSKSSKRQKILTEDETRVAYINFNNFGENEQFNIYYNDETKQIGSFILNYKKSIILNTVPEFISGARTYYLKYNVDSFANINLSYSDKKIFKCEVLPNNIISITRLDNKNFIENIELEITAFDKNHLFPSISKNITGIFYNDSVIYDYKIDESIYKQGEIVSNSFDLELYTHHSKNIEYIKYYDAHELDISKRNKIAIFDSDKDCYVISNIVTPISPESIEIIIKIKDAELIINKKLFENKIKLLNDKNNFSFNCYIANNELNFRLTNLLQNDYQFSKLEFYVDNNLFYTEKDVIFNNKNTLFTYNTSLEHFSDVYTFTVKGFNNFGKINLIKSLLVNCNSYKDINASLVGFNEFCLLELKDVKNISLNSDIDSKYIYLEIEDMFGNTFICNPEKGMFNLDISVGYYCFKVIYKKHNYKKVVNLYNVEVVNNRSVLIDYSKDYKCFDKITEIIVSKRFNTSFEFLSPSLLHYCNNELIEVITPMYEGDNIRFNINKKIGINRLIYKDNYNKIEFDSFNYDDGKNSNQYKIFSIHTDNQTMFYNDEDVVYLRNLEDLYIKTLGITEIRTLTKKIRTVVKQKTSDYVTTTIFKEFMPCILQFYIDDTIVKEIEVDVDSDKPVRYPIFSQGTKNDIDINKLKIMPSKKIIYKDSYSLSMNFRVKHFLLSYAIGVAKIYNANNFLNLTEEEQEEFLYNLSIGIDSANSLKTKIIETFKGEL